MPEWQKIRNVFLPIARVSSIFFFGILFKWRVMRMEKAQKLCICFEARLKKTIWKARSWNESIFIENELNEANGGDQNEVNWFGVCIIFHSHLFLSRFHFGSSLFLCAVCVWKALTKKKTSLCDTLLPLSLVIRPLVPILYRFIIMSSSYNKVSCFPLGLPYTDLYFWVRSLCWM